MPIKIKLVDGETLLVDVDIGEWNKAFQRAFERDAMLEIEDSEGGILGINPHQVLYLEEASEEDSEELREPAAL
ncbi:MAG: hypothetical protein AABM29_07035 [Actinomycetota bacterium]